MHNNGLILLVMRDRETSELLTIAEVWTAFCVSPFLPDGPLHESVIGDRLESFLVRPADCGGLGAAVRNADFQALMRHVVALKRAGRKAVTVLRGGDGAQVTHGH